MNMVLAYCSSMHNGNNEEHDMKFTATKFETDTVLTIRRPNGKIEYKTIKCLAITEAHFAKGQRDTKAGGGGDVLSYKHVRRELAPLQVAKLEAALAEERMDVMGMVKANLKVRELQGA